MNTSIDLCELGYNQQGYDSHMEWRWRPEVESFVWENSNYTAVIFLIQIIVINFQSRTISNSFYFIMSLKMDTYGPKYI